MKIQIITLLAAITLLYGCQTKTANTEATSKTKSCCADSNKFCCTKSYKRASCVDSSSISTTGVKVIYFHNERRCSTCMAVEEGAAEVVKQIADSSVTFNSYQIGDPKSIEVEKKYKVEGQTLLIIGKGKITNLTNFAFLYALVKPDKYKGELKVTIEKQK